MSKARTAFVAVLACAVMAALSPATQGAIKDEQVQKMREAAPEKAPAEPLKPRRLLVFTLCHGFRHGSIPYVARALEMVGEKTGAYETVVSDDPGLLRPESLKQFDAVCMNNNTTRLQGAFEDEELRQSLLDFVREGGGLVGIHAATDCFYKWPEYGEMIGGYFWGHPWHENVAIEVEEPEHPLCAPFEDAIFKVTDEIYQLRDPYSREKLRVLLSLDTDRINMAKGGIRREDKDFAVSWVRSYGRGRVFYCSLGHRNEITWNPTVLRHYLAGIQFAFGDLPAPTAPGALARPAFIGDWEGVRTADDGTRSRIVAQVIARGNNRYEVNLLQEFETREPKIAVLEGKEQGGKVVLEGKQGGTSWTGTIGEDRFSGRFQGQRSGSFTMCPVVRLSPTLGADPPKGAAVLFDGSGAEDWKRHWSGGRADWKFVDGAMAVIPGSGSAVSKQEFGDHKIHLEFWLPLQPGSRGQGRANSGVYVQQRFEVQILDSYGLEGRSNECGGLYKVAAPRLNACAPPEQWQTYDITFRAARFDDEGNLMENARMTVYHNGVLIHDDVELPHGTGGRKGRSIPREGSILLQDHRNPVRYRNIWVQELD